MLRRNGLSRHAADSNLARWCLSIALFPQYHQPGSCLGPAAHSPAGSKQNQVLSRDRSGWTRPTLQMRFDGVLQAGASETAIGQGEERVSWVAGKCMPRQQQARLPVSQVQHRCLHVGSQSTAGEDDALELDVAEARKLASKMRRERQLAFSFPSGVMGKGHEPRGAVVVKVSIDQEVRTLLKLAARERRGRVWLDVDDTSLAALTKALEARFPIGAVPYRLQARWQLRTGVSKEDGQADAWRQRQALSLSDDQAVARFFELASGSSDDHVRLELHVLMSSNARVKDEKASEEVLKLLDSSTEWCMVSFYSFSPIKHTVTIAEDLQREWSKIGIIGRTYVAREGINAQLAVPDKLLQHLRQHVSSGFLASPSLCSH